MQISYTIGWTALSSMLAAFKQQFGPAILLQLNMAYFLPSIPVLYLQTQYDAHFNSKYGLPQATAARMIVGELLSSMLSLPDPKKWGLCDAGAS